MRERKANGAANESRTTVRVMACGQAAVATFGPRGGGCPFVLNC
jgi:hypothetical protein